VKSAALFLFFAHLCSAGVYLRVKVHEPAAADVHVLLAGYIHESPWYLPKGRLPIDKAATFPAGTWSPWFDILAWADGRLHKRQNRAGGIAEFANMTLDLRCSVDHATRDLELELATKPGEVVRSFRERFTGSKTSLLISPDLKADAEHLETASEMAERRLAWAREATGGRRASPSKHILQTSLWAAQREELQAKELQTLSLLGFNVVGNKKHDAFPELREPGHTHRVSFGPAATKAGIDAAMAKELAGKSVPAAGVPFGLSDEICARPRIGDNAQARAHFHAWLAAEGVAPKALGVTKLEDVVPLETPEAFTAAKSANEAAARRVFYYSSRFRQQAGTERIRWHSEAYRRLAGPGPLTSTLVADHPYFGGTGLGMGMTPNTTWGGAPLALDWFDLARTRAVDLIGIEDWMGLQYMYGSHFTWEGFQLMGFQAAMMRSGGISRGGDPLPIIAWITPSDETNFRLKASSALCQGAKHFFFWTYGPTCTSTENYWSDLRGAYDGVATLSRHLAFSEPIIADGRLRPTRIAMLYSLSSDLWQPFGYLHMLERRCAYLAFVHAQHRIDFLTEDDIDAGRLANYDVLWTSDPCISTRSAAHIRDWAADSAHRLLGSCGAGHFNEFGEPVDGLAQSFGFRPDPARKWTIQKGRYRYRAGLNAIRELRNDGQSWIGLGGEVDTSGEVRSRFADGGVAEIAHAGNRYFCGSPGVSYAQSANFVLDALSETWPADWRDRLLDGVANSAAVQLSHPVVEAGLYESEAGAALVLANFAYQPIEALEVSLSLPFAPSRVRSAEKGSLEFQRDGKRLRLTVPLGLSDILRFDP
jgi:hypothetical protein